MTNTQTREQEKAIYAHQREFLKNIAKQIRTFLKKTGGTYSVRVQTNNIIWMSGAYSFGVDYNFRVQAEDLFRDWLKELVKREGLYLSKTFSFISLSPEREDE